MQMKNTIGSILKVSTQSCSKSELINSIMLDDSEDNEVVTQLQESIRNKWSIIKRKKFKDALPILIDDIQERLGTTAEDFRDLLNFSSPFYTDMILSRF